MSQDWNEGKMKELFGELRREDEQLSPPFVRDWGQASARMEKLRRLRPAFQIAALAMILIILVGSVVIAFKQQTPPFSDLVWGIRFDNPAQAQSVWFDQQQERSQKDDRRRLP